MFLLSLFSPAHFPLKSLKFYHTTVKVNVNFNVNHYGAVIVGMTVLAHVLISNVFPPVRGGVGNVQVLGGFKQA